LQEHFLALVGRRAAGLLCASQVLGADDALSASTSEVAIPPGESKSR
jgi:hypothetical protein